MEELERIRHELSRIAAEEMTVTLDREFEPEAGTLVKVEYADAYWHLLPKDFEELLKELPVDAGAERVREKIEFDVIHVWHGPAPKGDRDE